MSFYATIHGSLRYADQKDFDAAKKLLADGNWINEDGMFLDECSNVIDSGTMELHINPANRTIAIPYFCHRNLARLLDDLVKGSTGTVVWTSTDGCFEGGVYSDGEHKCYDLEKWARANGDEDIPDIENDWENYCEWANEVESDFHEAYS